jgi:hypothetical protein
VRVAASALGLVIALVAAGSAFSMRAVGPEEGASRDCGTSVHGDLGSDWMRSSVVVGPLAFVRARAYATSTHTFAGVGSGRYRGTKLLALVRTGWVARLVVPAAERQTVALQYARADFNKAVVPAESEHDVTFTACPPGRPLLGPKAARWTQFNGAIVVAGRRCVTLTVYAARQGHPLPPRPLQAHLSFGAGSCRG